VFDIGWTELLVIACVTVLVVGPKELPGLLRTLGKTVGNLRKMAGDFQKQFDEAMREAELDEVRKKMNQPFQPLEDARKAALDFQQKVADTVRIPESPSATHAIAAATAEAPASAAEVAASIPEPAMAPQLATPPAELQAASAPVAPKSAKPSTAPAAIPAASAASAEAVKKASKKAVSAPPAASGKAKAAAKSSAGTKGGKAAAEKVAAGAATGEKPKARTGGKS
jgi:sec-independent protein translocase protein TatB